MRKYGYKGKKVGEYEKFTLSLCPNCDKSVWRVF